MCIVVARWKILNVFGNNNQILWELRFSTDKHVIGINVASYRNVIFFRLWYPLNIYRQLKYKSTHSYGFTFQHIHSLTHTHAISHLISFSVFLTFFFSRWIVDSVQELWYKHKVHSAQTQTHTLIKSVEILMKMTKSFEWFWNMYTTIQNPLTFHIQPDTIRHFVSFKFCIHLNGFLNTSLITNATNRYTQQGTLCTTNKQIHGLSRSTTSECFKDYTNDECKMFPIKRLKFWVLRRCDN